METFKRFMRRGDVLLGLGIWALASLVSLGDHFDLNKSEWASWVQAVGAIGAIGGAFYFGERQADAARHAAAFAQDRDRKTKLQSIFAICKAANHRSELVRAIFANEYDSVKRAATYHPTLIQSMINAMDQVPVHEIGDSRAVAAFMDMKDQLSFVIRAIQKFDARSECGTGDEGGLDAQRQEVLGNNIVRHVDYVSRCFDLLKEKIGG